MLSNTLFPYELLDGKLVIKINWSNTIVKDSVVNLNNVELVSSELILKTVKIQ